MFLIYCIIFSTDFVLIGKNQYQMTIFLLALLMIHAFLPMDAIRQNNLQITLRIMECVPIESILVPCIVLLRPQITLLKNLILKSLLKMVWGNYTARILDCIYCI